MKVLGKQKKQTKKKNMQTSEWLKTFWIRSQKHMKENQNRQMGLHLSIKLKRFYTVKGTAIRVKR
jgi:hypothetical protein